MMKTDDILKAEREAHEKYERETMIGEYSIAQLREAFDLVANKENWKYQIEAVVAFGQLKKVMMAIEFFTGSKARAKLTVGGLAYVQALGYYETCGA